MKQFVVCEHTQVIVSPGVCQIHMIALNYTLVCHGLKTTSHIVKFSSTHLKRSFKRVETYSKGIYCRCRQ